jgi:hypothetical protein
MASMNYFDSDMSNSTNMVVYFDGKDSNLYLRLRAMSHTIYAPKFEQTITKNLISTCAVHTFKPGDKIKNKISYTVVNVLSIYIH